MPRAIYAHACAHAIPPAYAHANICTCNHAHAIVPAHAHAHACARNHAHTITPAYAHAHKCTCNHAHAITPAHAHAYTCTRNHAHAITPAHAHACAWHSVDVSRPDESRGGLPCAQAEAARDGGSALMHSNQITVVMCQAAHACLSQPAGMQRRHCSRILFSSPLLSYSILPSDSSLLSYSILSFHPAQHNSAGKASHTHACACVGRASRRRSLEIGVDDRQLAVHVVEPDKHLPSQVAHNGQRNPTVVKVLDER
eukprot:350659-Chlamydomonas_euryale.AAC.2